MLPPLFHPLRLPVIAAPMFIISTPAMVIAACQAGIVGSFPSLNARPQPELDTWLSQINDTLAVYDAAHPRAPAAPYAVNLIVHKTNDRLDADLATCVRHKVPLVITSLGARPDVNDAIHAYGGLVLHDVIDNRFAHKAIEKGADGLIAVATGAGGHAGTLSPFALIQEIRQWFSGPLALSGAIATGGAILAARAMGADLAYIGSAFIATQEANASLVYKQAILAGTATDIINSSLFTGVHGNYLRSSIEAAGLDPENLPDASAATMDIAGLGLAKAWRDIWGCGQGIGVITDIPDLATRIARLGAEYETALGELRK